MFKSRQLAIFDLDGVLTETSTHHFTAWRALAQTKGITLNADFEVHLKGVSRQASLDKILALGSKTYTQAEKATMQAEKNAHYQRLIANFTEADLFPGARELLQFLKDQGIYIALASASKNGPTLLHALRIEDYFDYIADPRLHPSKPAPDLFLAPMHHFGLKPNNCIGIEDALAGIEAIKAANMVAIGIGSLNDLPGADYHFDAIEDLLKHSITNRL